jgi:dTDP-glucose 4,6-dehydratase
MNLFVTGGCGFIGSHFIRLVLKQPRYRKVRLFNLDAMTYAGKGRNLEDVERDSRYRFIKVDIASPKVRSIFKKNRPDAVVNFAAESHVDRSLLDPMAFWRTNTLGVQNLLDAVRATGGGRFVQVSTDEVYGSIPGKGRAREDSPLLPSSPYSASKTAADLCCHAIHKTYHQDVVVTRCTNNYGPNQFPEKLIPLMITHALHDLPLPVYGDGMQRRDWIYVEDHCRGILKVLEKGRMGEIYNFGIGSEPPNIDIVRQILKILGKPESLIKHVKDRPGHDRRYAVDPSKAERELGWRPMLDFPEGIRRTVEWYRTHPGWWLRLKDAEFRKYYHRNYHPK